MYNLALSHHLAALSKPRVRLPMLQSASLLYENAYLLLQSEEVDISALFSVALSNNLGQALMGLKRFSEAKSCFEQLQSILQFLVLYCNDNERGQLEGFFQTTMVCMNQGRTTAAAA